MSELHLISLYPLGNCKIRFRLKHSYEQHIVWGIHDVKDEHFCSEPLALLAAETAGREKRWK